MDTTTQEFFGQFFDDDDRLSFISYAKSAKEAARSRKKIESKLIEDLEQWSKTANMDSLSDLKKREAIVQSAENALETVRREEYLNKESLHDLMIMFECGIDRWVLEYNDEVEV
ncbi:MAG: hypothetical protein ACRCXZ_09270 [Patescibacteria group bacterium]